MLLLCVLIICMRAARGLNGCGLRAHATPSNRAARRVEDELRVLEQSMKSLNSTVTQVLPTKTTNTSVFWWAALLAVIHAAGHLPHSLCLFLSSFYDSLFDSILNSFMPLTKQRLCTNNTSHLRKAWHHLRHRLPNYRFHCYLPLCCMSHVAILTFLLC